MCKYGVFSGLFFLAFGLNTNRYVFSPNAGKYGPEKTPYLDTFHAVICKMLPFTGSKKKIIADSGYFTEIFGIRSAVK